MVISMVPLPPWIHCNNWRRDAASVVAGAGPFEGEATTSTLLTRPSFWMVSLG